MKHISILHYTVPPVVGGIEGILYHHLRLLHAAGYDLRVIAGKGDEGYYETSFLHSVDFRPIPELHPLHPDVRAANHDTPAGEVRFNTLRDYLVDILRPLLQNQDICMIHNAVTTSGHLPLTAALHQLAEEGITRFAAWCHDFPAVYLPRPDNYPESLPFTAWPGVEYIATAYPQRDSLASVLGIPAESIRVIPSGIEPAEAMKWDHGVQHLVRRLGLRTADPLIIFPCCSLLRGEEDIALHMMTYLVRHKERAVLLVAGLSPAEDPSAAGRLGELKTLRAELGLEEAVHFVFDLDDGETTLRMSESVLSDLYGMADLLFYPESANEGNYAPLLGAALARVPVFTTGTPLIQELTHGLVQRFDPHWHPAEIAQSILEYLETDRAYQLRRNVLERHSWGAILEEGLLPLLHGSQPSAYPHP